MKLSDIQWRDIKYHLETVKNKTGAAKLVDKIESDNYLASIKGEKIKVKKAKRGSDKKTTVVGEKLNDTFALVSTDTKSGRSILHISTGLSLATFPNRKKALRAWTAIKELVIKLPPFKTMKEFETFKGKDKDGWTEVARIAESHKH